MTPPMPNPAMKRAALNHSGSFARPAAAVKALKSPIHIAMAQRRPILSAIVPKRIAPNIMPKRAELTIKPAWVGSTPMSFMMDGSAIPATARS